MITTISARVLGQRIRQLRTRRGFTQQDLASDDYSKSYISAIEQGKTRPSLEALQRLASRLDVPVGNLLDPDAPGFMPADPEAMPRRVRRRRGVRAGDGTAPAYEPIQHDLQIAEAELFIYTGRAAEALGILRPLLPESAAPKENTPPGSRMPPLDTPQLQKAYYLAALAAVQTGNATEALEYVQKGNSQATRMGDREGLEQLRLVHGMAYHLADQPLSALELHRNCLDAANGGVVKDPNFKLRVLSNIASDYQALHDNERALATYKSALDLLKDLNNVERQAAVFWDISTGYTSERSFTAARDAALKALSIYEALDNMQTVAGMEGRYGQVLIEMGDAGAAEEYLRRSLSLAESLNSEMDRAVALTNLARLELKRNNLDEAGRLAMQAVEASRPEGAGQAARRPGRPAKDAKGGAEGQKSARKGLQSRTDAGGVLAGALALSGEIAAATSNTEQADASFNEAIRLLEGGQAGDMASDIYQRYAQVLAGRGQHEQASRYFEQAYKAVTKRAR